MPKSGQIWDSAILARSALLELFRGLAEPLVRAETWPALDAYTELCERQRSSRAPELEPVRFERQTPRQRRARRRAGIQLRDLYEGAIALDRRVPCLRESYHDLFNALAWAAFPRAKRAVHARQFRALCAWLPAGATRLPNRRTREQDALALFDEGGSVLVTTEPELGGSEGPSEPLAARAEGTAARVVLFGHALMEHVCFERRAVRSALLVISARPPLPAGLDLLDLVDVALARRLSEPGALSAPDFDGALSIDPPDDVRW